MAVGNAVLAGIAASDALCCLKLGVRSRGPDHLAAVSLVREIDSTFARDLERLLRQKDQAHYGDRVISADQLATALRSGRRLVQAVREALSV